MNILCAISDMYFESYSCMFWYSIDMMEFDPLIVWKMFKSKTVRAYKTRGFVLYLVYIILPFRQPYIILVQRICGLCGHVVRVLDFSAEGMGFSPWSGCGGCTLGQDSLYMHVPLYPGV